MIEATVEGARHTIKLVIACESSNFKSFLVDEVPGLAVVKNSFAIYSPICQSNLKLESC
jgi:hypothetical protein